MGEHLREQQCPPCNYKDSTRYASHVTYFLEMRRQYGIKERCLQGNKVENTQFYMYLFDNSTYFTFTGPVDDTEWDGSGFFFGLAFADKPFANETEALYSISHNILK